MKNFELSYVIEYFFNFLTWVNLNTSNTDCNTFSILSVNHLLSCLSYCPPLCLSYPLVLAQSLVLSIPIPPCVHLCHHGLICSSLLPLSYGPSTHTFNVMIFSSQWFSIAEVGLTFSSKPSFRTLLMLGGRLLWDSVSWLWSPVMAGCDLYTKCLGKWLILRSRRCEGKKPGESWDPQSFSFVRKMVNIGLDIHVHTAGGYIMFIWLCMGK